VPSRSFERAKHRFKGMGDWNNIPWGGGRALANEKTVEGTRNYRSPEKGRGEGVTALLQKQRNLGQNPFQELKQQRGLPLGKAEGVTSLCEGGSDENRGKEGQGHRCYLSDAVAKNLGVRKEKSIL